MSGFYDKNRRTGCTTRMLDRAIKLGIEGKEDIVIVSRTDREALNMMYRFAERVKETTTLRAIRREHRVMIVELCKYEFVTTGTCLLGSNRPVFWDHNTNECLVGWTPKRKGQR